MLIAEKHENFLEGNYIITSLYIKDDKEYYILSCRLQKIYNSGYSLAVPLKILRKPMHLRFPLPSSLASMISSIDVMSLESV